MNTILCFSANTEAVRNFFSETYGDDVVMFEGEVQDYDVIEHSDQVEIITCFTGSIFDRETIDRFPSLKLIATRSTGFDHIDVAYAQEKGIMVSNVPYYGANTVAEHAFALIQALSKKAFFAYTKVREDMNFSQRGTPALQGFDLMGKTIGIVGAGNIGRHSIKIAHGFGMNIVAFDLHPSDELTEKYGVVWAPNVEDVIKQSDVLTFHVPYNKHTHHLFKPESLFLIKESGLYLINTSRGEVVDTRALKAGLDSGKILGAGLDVLEHEAALGKNMESQDDPITEEIEEVNAINQELVADERVIVTPHNAFNTAEAIARIWQTTIENIAAYSNGQAENTVGS